MQTKQKYLVTLEGLVPVTLTYEVFAEDQEEAYKIIDSGYFRSQLLKPPFYDLQRLRKKKIVIKDVLSGVVKLMKNYI